MNLKELTIMDEIKIKRVVEGLIDTFLMAGEVSIKLRKEGLNKEIKSDNTPVSNGDLEVNKIITKKLLELTPDIPIVCLLYTSPSPRDRQKSRMPSSA